ncbi:MAG: hypothetical protein GX558_12580, partial [Clostridiales bacterium]|nr:hypothetical protein [Clostridiales bacterium]
MCDFLGMFHASKPRALQGIYDAPYLMMGRHALCAEGAAFDGGAAALAFGRVRNAAALRAAIEAEGYRPDRAGGVSALLLGAYRLWGEECVERIEGPVCCVVIDQDADRLLLSRDRMGEGRVFYAAHGASISFSSHPAPLLQAPHVSRAVDRDGFCEVFGLGPARTPGRTPFRDILELKPGFALLAGAGGCRLRPYFSLQAREHEHDLRTTIQTVREYTER